MTYPEGPSEGCIEAYTKDLKFIAKCPQSINYQTVDKDRLYLADNGVIKTYNKNGKLINTSKKYNNLVKIIGNYKVILDDKLRLITPDEKEIVFTKWNKKKMEFHSLISGWYKGGIYLVIEDKNVTTNEAWTYCKNHLDDCGIESKKDLNDISKGYEYYYIPKTGKKGKIATTIGGYAKPVLYLYPEEKTNVTVTFDKPDNLTTTYPKYKNNWSITAYPNGDLYDSDNKYYYALYWEELKNHEVTFNEGFYVNKDNAIEFLESKLTTLGLSPRERNEFIMYWLPILEKNEHNLIYFEQTEERDNYSKITITPKPDSILRIAMHVKKVNGKVNIKEQKLNTFKRNGFVAVEWGGVIH